MNPFRSTISDLVSHARVKARPRSRINGLLPHGERLTTAAGWGELDQAPLVGTPMHSALENHSGHLVHKWRHYPDIYAELLEPFRDGFAAGSADLRPLRFLEIGVSEGGSLELWRAWWGPTAVITGVDIDPTCADLVDPSVATIRIGSQADPDFLRSVVEEMGGVDIVLDDGSHVASHQKSSLDTLWPLLSEGGLYLCEDVHTAYWREFDGGLRRRGTAIEVAKDLVDDLHHWYYRVVGSTEQPKPQWPDLWSVSFYDSVIALRKRRREKPARFTRGDEVRPGSQWATDPTLQTS